MKKYKKIQEILHYLLKEYPYKSELSKTRITKLVYLADWESAKEYNEQITSIQWYFDRYGPYVPDVYEAAEKDSKIKIKSTTSFFGSPKEEFSLAEDAGFEGEYKLTVREINILDKIIRDTRDFNWTEFIDYVYNTYPIVNQQKYTLLNLVELAQKEKIKIKI